MLQYYTFAVKILQKHLISRVTARTTIVVSSNYQSHTNAKDTLIPPSDFFPCLLKLLDILFTKYLSCTDDKLEAFLG